MMAEIDAQASEHARYRRPLRSLLIVAALIAGVLTVALFPVEWSPLPSRSTQSVGSIHDIKLPRVYMRF